MNEILNRNIKSISKQMRYFKFYNRFLKTEFKSLIYFNLFFAILKNPNDWIKPKNNAYLYKFCKYIFFQILKNETNYKAKIEKYANHLIFNVNAELTNKQYILFKNGGSNGRNK
ncbi:MAG: hypothetical protein LBC64_07555 [Fibromonadaceae bacterium]|jgi:hypothetical protein|nr:hypothetical protein [Fibromonadaceae bacterium]